MVASYANGGNVTYFESFGVEHILKEIIKFTCKKNITTNIIEYKRFNNAWICIGFVNFTVKGTILLDYTNLFSCKKYEKNDEIIHKYFQ